MRTSSQPSDEGFSLPIFEALAPAIDPAEMASLIQAWTRPGDTVLDLAGRGGWVARSAVTLARTCADLESLSLTRLLADVIVRPPDLLHLDAAVQSIANRPMGRSTARAATSEAFTIGCPDCRRRVPLEGVIWTPMDPAAEGSGAGADATGEWPLRADYRCANCDRKQGEAGVRTFEHQPGDHAAQAMVEHRRKPAPQAVRSALRKRFPTPNEDDPLPDQLLGLHTPRQLIALAAILEGVELDARAASVSAALRLGFVHAVEIASRLNVISGEPPDLEIAGGTLAPLPAGEWREVDPWLAFEQGVRAVRDLVERVAATDPAQLPPISRFATDLGELATAEAGVMMGEATPGSLRRIGHAAERLAEGGVQSRVRLLLSQMPVQIRGGTLTRAYRDTAWGLGQGAASILPFDDLFQPPSDAPRQRASETRIHAISRLLAIAAPALAQDGRAAVILDDHDPLTLVATALGGAAVGYRLVEAQLDRIDARSPAVAVFVPPTGIVGPGPRTRANRPLPPVELGAGDPGAIAGQGYFAAPERVDHGPFRVPAATAAVTETAAEMLLARGEPACFEHLLGAVLVGLDRSGQLARYARHFRPPKAEAGWSAWIDMDESDMAASEERSRRQPLSRPLLDPSEPPPSAEALLELIREELNRKTNRRVRQIEPGQYWLGSADDRRNAAGPLSDRVEWAVFSLLSSATSNQMSRADLLARASGVFGERDVPDAELLEACLESYSAPESTPASIVLSDRLERRSGEHDGLIAALADIGHRLGMRVWIGRHQQLRPFEGTPLSEWLDPEEREVSMSEIAWGPEDEIERVDCAWYVRHKATLLFEVEWTAMVGDPILLRHSRFPDDDRAVRFLVIAPERIELLRRKLARSPLLRQAMTERNWHVLRWDQLAAFAAREDLSLGALEPYVGLDPQAVEHQLELFEGNSNP